MRKASHPILEGLDDFRFYDLASKVIHELCSTRGKSFEVHTPARVSDTDLVLYELLKRFKNTLGNENDTKIF